MSNTPQPAQAGPVILEGKHDGIATLVLNRPERLNALNNELASALNEALGRIAEDDTVRVVVLTGAGRAFCAGGDLAVIGKGRRGRETQELEPLLRAGMQAVLKMRTMPQPVIAAVNGAAAGAGMNIALAADIRIAAEEATFGENFAKVGLFPDYGGTYFLPQLVGPAKAAELFQSCCCWRAAGGRSKVAGAENRTGSGLGNPGCKKDSLWEREERTLRGPRAGGPGADSLLSVGRLQRGDSRVFRQTASEVSGQVAFPVQAPRRS